MVTIGIRANFFLGEGGAKPSLSKNVFVSDRKAAMLDCTITLPGSPHPVIISKNPAFWALYLAGKNEFRSFCSINAENFFHLFSVGFCPKNLALPKN